MRLFRGNGGWRSQCPAGDRQVSCLNAHPSQLNPSTPMTVPASHQTEQDPPRQMVMVRGQEGTEGVLPVL